MLVDYHVHGLGHATSKHTLDEVSAYLETARQRGVAQVGFADHDRYIDDYNVQAIREAAKNYPDVQVRIGVEIDYVRGAEAQFRSLISRYPFDFVIGSVHKINDWDFDSVAQMDRYENWEKDELYRQYFLRIEEVAKMGIFSFIGHLDLIKIFKVRSTKPVVEMAEQALQTIRQAGLPCEINTNGLNKPVQETYPERSLLERCFELGIPITLSSDAHFAHEVGRDLELARELAWSVGYRQVATFNQGKMILENL
ncbi:histidinol-phosphatase HisJ family protein [Heliophilum fasciatum]|uniref:Histidinol-phosphatase n=1 Tax=Heliophilum fasciatum TaxID=35700 RepID=A0A4R2RDE5_9FIRM|nr:histidinol-phosphatase HisJ family protein [Heliophilum fasciatum]MCW2279083.1 histidinol-phosphatase (PHP family) [Heliophilum fasciatum]TCP61480.1 histidinol-phosphatase (PHP family) [Heliophilum fasciatum]